jgi:RNA polymerase sigma-32 factor
LRLAAKVARRYRGCGLPLADLVVEANLGLVIAASRFEPDHGSRFSTYAWWWIKVAIHDTSCVPGHSVKIGTTSAQRAHDDGRKTEWEAMLVDDTPDAEAIVEEHDEKSRCSNALRAALDVLSERERRVLEARRLSENPTTLEQLGRELSLSSKRVWQIETAAFAKVKRATTKGLQRKNGLPLPSAELALA